MMVFLVLVRWLITESVMAEEVLVLRYTDYPLTHQFAHNQLIKTQGISVQFTKRKKWCCKSGSRRSVEWKLLCKR